MKWYDRETLRQRFADGSLPSETDFAHLINSSLNMVDEGFEKTPQDGFRIHSIGSSGALLSFYLGRAEDPSWSTAFGDGERLDLRRHDHELAPEPAPVVSFGAKGSVGIGTTAPMPGSRLDVAGTVVMRGRLGSRPRTGKPVVANGRWQLLAGGLQGCQAFEVVAGVGKPGSGRFALLHAIALNVYNPPWWADLFGAKKRIRSTHAYYSRRCDRLELRWSGQSGGAADSRFALEIRSGCDFQAQERKAAGNRLPAEQEAPIHVYLTQLWFQPGMEVQPREPQP